MQQLQIAIDTMHLIIDGTDNIEIDVPNVRNIIISKKDRIQYIKNLEITS